MTISNVEVAKSSEVIIVSTKPSVVPTVLTEAKASISSRNLLISVAMGVTIKQLESVSQPYLRFKVLFIFLM